MFYYHVKFAHLKICIAVNVYVNIFVSLVCATLLVLIYDYMVSKLMHKPFLIITSMPIYIYKYTTPNKYLFITMTSKSTKMLIWNKP